MPSGAGGGPEERIPIATYRGYPGGKKVWVEPEMHVRNLRTKQEAVVTDLLERDQLIVQPINRRTGDPQGRPVKWDAAEIKLSKLHKFPAQSLTNAEMKKWQIDRKLRQRQDRRDEPAQERAWRTATAIATRMLAGAK